MASVLQMYSSYIDILICIYSIILYFNVLHCLRLYTNIAHANMLVIYLFSFKYILCEGKVAN